MIQLSRLYNQPRLTKTRPAPRLIRRLALFTAVTMMVAAAIQLLIPTVFTLNASWSAPHWGYTRIPIAIWPFEVKRGDWIQFTPPVDAPWPYIKQVRGLAGDNVAVTPAREIFVGNSFVGHAKTHSLSGRVVDAISAGTIPAGHYFVAAPHPDSHDSRYAEIGLVPDGAILARVWPLPDIPWFGLEGPLMTPKTLNEEPLP